MRTAAALLVSLALLACARSSTPEPIQPNDDAEAATQPAESEGPAPESAAAPTEEGLCALGPDWSPCAGQRVRVRGRNAEHVMQHPIVALPDEAQGYMDTDGRQVIVVTKVPFDCRGAMSVVGTLRAVDLGGEPGTKSSYSGWSIADAEVTCE